MSSKVSDMLSSPCGISVFLASVLSLLNLSDMLWFIAEYCTAMGWNLDDVMQYNIDKLIARYPDGFEADKSLHRAEGDI